jgi:hypothetical protein
MGPSERGTRESRDPLPSVRSKAQAPGYADPGSAPLTLAR